MGKTSDPNVFVAVVATDPKRGEDRREVSAYLSDGKGLFPWFQGSTAGNELDLGSGTRARLKGELAPEATTGTVTFSGGQSLDFEALPATGVADLYQGSVSESGQVRGTSERGGLLEAQIAQEKAANGEYPITGTLTPPDEGEPVEFELFEAHPAPGRLRLIVLPDLEMRGRVSGRGEQPFWIRESP